VPEAARYLRMSDSTLKGWVAGRDYLVAGGERHSAGLIRLPDQADGRLSFSNLIEAHVLSALRMQYRIKMPQVRMALEYSREHLGIERILLSDSLRAMSGNVFWKHLDALINIGMGGQVAMPEILGAYLERVEWHPQAKDHPLRMFPLTRPDYHDPLRLVAIDPEVAFGRPVVQRKAITTSIIAERWKVGESILAIAEDYDLEAFEVEEALRSEALTRAA